MVQLHYVKYTPINEAIIKTRQQWKSVIFCFTLTLQLVCHEHILLTLHRQMRMGGGQEFETHEPEVMYELPASRP